MNCRMYLNCTKKKKTSRWVLNTHVNTKETQVQHYRSRWSESCSLIHASRWRGRKVHCTVSLCKWWEFIRAKAWGKKVLYDTVINWNKVQVQLSPHSNQTLLYFITHSKVFFPKWSTIFPTWNQGVISSMCRSEACFLFSQICRGFTPILPNVLLCSTRFPSHFLQLHLQKGQQTGSLEDFFFTLNYSERIAEHISHRSWWMCGRPIAWFAWLTKANLRGYHNNSSLTRPRRKHRGTRGNDKQTSLPFAQTFGGLYLSASVIRLCRTLSSEKTHVSIETCFGIFKTLQDECFCGTRVVSQMLWE